MQSVQAEISEFRRQLASGVIQKAYRILPGYMRDLRAYFRKRYPDHTVSGLYQGYPDMTCFAIVPPSLKHRSLKIAIVFNCEAFRFEAWLAGTNRQVQRRYWELFRDSVWTEYRVVTPSTGVDAIVECILAEDVDFGDPDSLTKRIEKKSVEFIGHIERFLSGHENG